MSYLGDMCLKGHGVKKDFDKGVEWLTKAVFHGNLDAADELNALYKFGFLQKKSREIIDLLMKVLTTKVGDENALMILSGMYLNGELDKKYFGRLVKLLGKGAELYYPDAMAFLGFMHGRGDGVLKNLEKGRALVQKANKPPIHRHSSLEIFAN